MMSLGIVILILSVTAEVFGLGRFRRYHINETISTRIVLRCPVSLSDEDSIMYYHLKDNGDVIQLAHQGAEALDSFVLDVAPEARSGHYECRVTHKKDGSKETVAYYIDRKDRFKDIQMLQYTLATTTIKEAKVGDSVSLKCPSDGKEAVYLWYGPDLLQLNNSMATLDIASAQERDFGEYFCGKLEDVKEKTLLVSKFAVKLPSALYDPNLKEMAKSLLYPTNKLGERIVYLPPSAYTMTRRIIWEYPPQTVLLNQGRDFSREIFTHDMTKEEFYYRITDRIDPSFSSAKRVLFQSQKMSEQSFSVNISPTSADIIIGNSVELFCNNSNNLKAVWYFKQPSSAMLRGLPEGATSRIEGPLTIVQINSTDPKHSGTYLCDAKKGVAQVVLTVLPKPKLVVSPREIVVRPGISARFLCQLIDGRGKVLWRRKDKKGFQLNVESRIGGDTQAILVIDSVPKDLNGSVYECIHNDMTAEALLMVKDLCPDNMRACQSGDCLDAVRFCDGKSDCADKSDEDTIMCAKCEPNQQACMAIDGKDPVQKCVVKHWFCDGDNDCGNGYDELNCPKINKDTCLGTNFVCNDNVTLIPRSLWCDKSPNCPNGDDEFNCRAPEVVLPTKDTTYVIHQGSSVTMVCEVVSVPTSTINWRYNWGALPARMNFSVAQKGKDCNRIRNSLTIHEMNPDFAGVYTCEAVSIGRAMAKDYTLFVTSEILCKRPYFNNAASIKDMCLKCYCSNVTDDCTSATKYFQSSTPRVSTHPRAYLTNYLTKRIMETGTSKSLFDPRSKIYSFDGDSYASFVINPNMYLTSHFGLSGSWLNSYSYYMDVKIKLTGHQFEDIPGPAVIIKGSRGKSLHWCRSENSPVIYSSPTGYDNTLRLSLWEKEDWYNNIACSSSATRENILDVLTDVAEILIRIKYYTNQTGFELHSVTLEHAEPATKDEETGVLVPRIEMCNCPYPYAGLSCEKCVDGYKRNKKNQCVKKCPANCDECKEKGECIKCQGHRSGPQCLQCKAGYTRVVDKNMEENCVECPCADSVTTKVIGNECVQDLGSPGNVKCKCSGKEVNDASCDRCLRKPLLPEDEKKCFNRTTTDNPTCEKDGTVTIVDKKCKCKMGYKGESCNECEPGYFQYEGKCLKCFCSNATNQCKASSDYKFENLTLNSVDYKLNFTLTNRLLSGVYDADSKDGDLKVNRTHDKIVLKRNPNGKGLIYLTIKVNNVENPNSINTYTMMYGGRMMFKFEYVSEDLKSLFINDVMPFLEIESKKFGRLWAAFKYNDETKFMEVKLAEDCFPSWRLGNGDSAVDRETFLRALMTAQHLSIGVPFNNDNVKKVRISQLTIEHARKRAGEGRVAPVESCSCPSDVAGDRCEECNKPGFQSEMTLSQRMPDFVCGQCTGPSCDKCAVGTYNYDFLLNKNFSSCQPGIEITTKGRVIRLNRGESLSIPCSVKSHRGGVAVHSWSKRGGRDQLSTFRHMTADGQSHLILNFDNIKLSDSGYYVCDSKNVFSNASEEFYIEVIDQEPRLKVDIFVVTVGKQNVKFNATVTSPSHPTDYKIIWSVVKDGKVTTEDSHKVIVSQEQSHYKLDVEIIANVTDGVQLHGVVVGSRVTNPFFYEVRHNITRNISIQIDTVTISTDKNVLHLKFLEPGVVRVITSPNLRIETFWYKITENGTEVPLPHGITSRGSELTVWSASESHNGKYVGYVVNTGDGSMLGKVHTEIKVTPMVPDIGRELINVTRETNISILLYIPLPNYCPQQTWELHSPRSNSVIDITKNVVRLSEKEVLIYYPLGLGDIVRFRCAVIPDAKVTGEIKISVGSKYPIIEVIPKIESNQLVTLECIDNNHVYTSNVTWYFKDREIGKNAIVDWRTLGGFRSDIHEGKYTCFASNSFNNASVSIYLPQTRAPTQHGTIKISSSTNPMAFENGTMRIYLIPGQRLQVGATIVGFPPLGTEIKWFLNNNTIKATKSGKFFSSLEIAATTTKEHCGEYRVELLLPNGTTITKTFEVVPQFQLQYYTKIDGLNANGDLSILEGDNRVIGCKLIRRENTKEIEETNIKIDWKFVTSMGRTTKLEDINGLKRTSDNRAFDITNARQVLNQYRGQCIVNYNGEEYSSKFFAFDVNTRNIEVRVKLIGLKENKYVENEEGTTSEVICQAYDESSKRVLPNAAYKWEMTFNDGKIKANWEKMIISDDKITFGGLVYHKVTNSAVGRCRVNYFGTIAISEDFTFRVKRKEINETLPQIKIEVIYDTNRPPYPISVSCRDPSIRPGRTSVITFNVSNPNFERSSVTTAEGRLLINFTTNSTTFNPFKDSGVYTFTVTNSYGHKTKTIILPQYKNPNSNYSARIVIYSTTGEIDKNDKIRVQTDTKLQLICVYYGHPSPINLKWTFGKSGHFSPTTESSDYWTSATITKFRPDISGTEFECNAQSHQGILTKKVMVEEYSYGIKVEILDKNNAPMERQRYLQQGTDFVIKYRATDLFTKKEVTNISGIWEFRLSKSSNFTKITNATFTNEEVKFDGVQMTIYRIIHTGSVEFRCKFENKTDIFVSETITVNVKENEEIHPEPHFFLDYKGNIYPKKLKCLDTRMEPSKVTLSKSEGSINEKLKYVEKEKQMHAVWDPVAFSPFYDMGKYKCEAKNRYKTIAIYQNLPEQSDKKLGTYVKFESRLNEIVIKERNKTIDVIDGDKFMIICNYYGSRAPIMDVDIVLESKSGKAQSPMTFASKFEIQNYYSWFSIDKFDMSRHSGLYTCRSRNQTNDLFDTVLVQGIKPGINIIIEGLDSENNLKLTMGSTRSFKCSAIDAVTKKPVDEAKYDWPLETLKGTESINIEDLSETVKRKEGNITLGIIRANEDMRGRCEVTLKNNKYYSNYFEVTVLQNEMKKPKLQFVEVPDTDNRGIPGSVRCTDERINISEITITRPSGAPPDIVYNKSRNSVELIFPSVIKDPMLYVGSYRCEGTNKYGKDWKMIDVIFRPALKPLMVKIESVDVAIVTKQAKKKIEVMVGKRFEVDCLYSGDKQPIVVDWILIQNTNVIKLEKDKPINGFTSYQKRSDCLSLVQEGFAQKNTFSLNCSAKDSSGAIKEDIVDVDVIVIGTKVVVSGLDNNTFVSGTQGSDRVLICKVIDLNSEIDISNNFSFSWHFTDESGKSIDLSKLSEKINVDNGKLELKSMLKLYQTVIGQCVAHNKSATNQTSPTFKYIVKEDEAKRPKINFTEIFGDNKMFPAKLDCKDWNDKTSDVTVTRSDGKSVQTFLTKLPGSTTVTFPVKEKNLIPYEGNYICLATNKYGSDRATLATMVREPLTVSFNSSINKIETNDKGQLYTIVRKNRELQLDCFVTGTPTPTVKLNIITEKTTPDLPIPERKSELTPGDKNSVYIVNSITEKHHQLTRPKYTESPGASFSCDATSNGKTVSTQVKVIEFIDLYQANLITEQTNELNQIVYPDKPFEIGCQLTENKVVIKMHSIKWVFRDKHNNPIDLKKLAKKYQEKENKLQLEGLSLANVSNINGRCIIFSNETYDTMSNEFVMTLKESPRITGVSVVIDVDKVKSTFSFPLNYTMDAMKNTFIMCLANATAGASPSISWFKCYEGNCNLNTEFASGNSLMFFEDSTKYKDSGQYACRVTLSFEDKSPEQYFIHVININRRAAPKRIPDLTMSERQSAILICDNQFSSPEGNVTWTFTPKGKNVTEVIPGVIITNEQISKLTLTKPLKPEYSGTYVCNVTNEYGTGGRTFNVEVPTTWWW